MRHIVRFLAVLAVLSGGFQPARAAPAAGQVGNGDPSSCTFSALSAALAGGGLITFNCGPNAHTIILTAAGGMAPPAGATTIDGGGLITLSAANVADRRHFNVGASASLTLTRLTLINASMTTAGGGSIQNLGRLVLDAVTLRDNSALNGWGGGAISHLGLSLVVRNSIFQTNASAGGGALYNNAGKAAVIENTQFLSNTVNGIYGGAITNQGLLTVTTSTFTNNQELLNVCPLGVNYICGGGAIMNYPGGVLVISQSGFDRNHSDHDGGALLNLGTLTVSASTFTANMAVSLGGAIANRREITALNAAAPPGPGNSLIAGVAGRAELSGLVVTGNQAAAGGGLSNLYAVLELMDSTVAGNQAASGGGYYNYDGHSTFEQVTFSQNSAVHGGGVYNSGKYDDGEGVFMTHVTLSGNRAEGSAGSHGGGLYNYDRAHLVHVTFSGNTSAGAGAGLANVIMATELHVTNVLFANNRLLTGVAQNCTGQAPDLAMFNLTTDTTCVSGGSGNRVNVPALLGPMADNGGSTLTHLPAPGSEPIDHGTCLGGLPEDQRGLDRSVGAGCDIGAVERQTDDAGWYVFVPSLMR